MTPSLIGRKLGMTQIFSQQGEVLLPVTVILVEPNVVAMIKEEKRDGYQALQLASEDCRKDILNKPEIGHLAKNGISPKKILREFAKFGEYSVGDVINLNIFKEGEIVKVTGISKGKGFAGVIKRHNQSRGPMSHGSGYHRGVGSMGPIAPNRILKGKKLPGRMGNEQKTIRGLHIHQVITEKNIILIAGSIPGPRNGIVTITKQNT